MSAIRYINWLHYNAANIAKSAPLEQYHQQTEGDSSRGAYDTRSVPKKRNDGALYWLPNEDEWLKACFFQGDKWDETLLAKGSNCYTINGWAYPYPHIKPIGKEVEPSYYGTYDQQGNAAEWIENASLNDDMWKLSKGGSLIRSSSYAMFSDYEGDFPTKSISTFGLRICRVADEELLETSSPDICISSVSCSNQRIFNQDSSGDFYVLVGNPGNAGDIVNQFKGCVNYDYYIARTELSNSSYCKFLNSVAYISDPYGLYDENMAGGACGGIIREILNERFAYYCKPGWENKPVVYVNYYDIARYANWMHYGCPVGECVLGVTEGTSEDGAYDTTDFEDVRYGKKDAYKTFGKRNEGARYWIPSENEWYKAAYHNPTKIGNRKYYDYPTQTSNAPSLEDANYMLNNHFSIGEPYYLAPVDSFENSQSYYGTLQQGGNVWEWIEDWQYGQVGSRGLRGGSWSYTSYGLNAINTDPGGMNDSGYVFGARICMSTTDEGWKPVNSTLFTKLYQYLVTLPKNHLILLVVGLSLSMSLLGIIFLIIICLFLKRK